MKGSFSVAGSLLILLCPLVAVAQECPFPDSAAISDTLTPSLYFPMSVGNRWEYTERSGPFLGDPYSWTIVGDTLIESIQFFKFRVEVFEYDPNLITTSRITRRYRTIIDSTLATWTPGSGIVMGPAEFWRPFNTCYEHHGLLVGVGGEYGGTIDFPSGSRDTSVVVGARKTIGSEISAVEFYAHGVGRYHVIGDPNLTTELVYVRIKEMEIGTPLTDLFAISVNVEADADPYSFGIEVAIFPNPFWAGVNFKVRSPRPQTATLRVIDPLGRTIASIWESVKLDLGVNSFAWSADFLSPGLYFLRLSTDDETILEPLVKAR